MKKIMTIALMFMLVLTLGKASSFAFEDVAEVQQEVDVVNAEIEEMIAEAQEEADAVLASDLSQEAKDAKIAKIVEKLVDKTNAVAGKLIMKAADHGYEVICEYVAVEVGNVTVLIDPLRVGEFIEVG